MKRSRGIFGGLFGRKPRQEKSRQGITTAPAGRISEKAPFSSEEIERYKIGDLIRYGYKVYRVLTAGGFGVVYVCSSEILGPIAIKGVKEKYILSDENLKSFQHEAYEWSQLGGHRNIVQALWTMEIERRPFIFMEYVAGVKDIGSSLADWIEQGRLDLKIALKMATDVASGMEYSYSQRKLIHRDLTPDNVLVTADGVAKVTDFGLAKAAAEFGPSPLGESGETYGKPAYMSPDQWADFSAADTRSDIYSFGCLLYEMLTGDWPFYPAGAATKLEAMALLGQAATAARASEEIRAKHFQEVPRNPRRRDRSIPVVLDDLVMKCLEKEPARRYEDFKQIRDELAGIYQEISGEQLKLEFTQPEQQAEHLLNRATSMSALGLHEEALSYCEEALKKAPEFADAWGAKGNALINLRRYREAVNCFDRSLELEDNESSANWTGKGLALSAMDLPEEALVCHERAIRIAPRLVEAWTNKGSALSQLERNKEAVACCDKALKINPGDTFSWLMKGDLLAKLVKYDESLDCYDKALEIDRKYAAAWSKKGILLAGAKEHDGAIECYDRALEIDPGHVEALVGRGNSLAQLERYDEAIECYDRALDIKGSAETWTNKGNVLAVLGKHDEAVVCYDKALAIDRGLAEIWIGKGSSLVWLERYQEAVECYDRALEIKPEWWTVSEWRQEILEALAKGEVSNRPASKKTES